MLSDYPSLIGLSRQPGFQDYQLTVLNNGTESPCEGCGATCCKNENRKSFGFIHLGPEEIDGYLARYGHADLTAKKNGDVFIRVRSRCRHLGLDDRCTIWAHRPRACVFWSCARSYSLFGENEGWLRSNPKVRDLLNANGFLSKEDYRRMELEALRKNPRPKKEPELDTEAWLDQTKRDAAFNAEADRHEAVRCIELIVNWYLEQTASIRKYAETPATVPRNPTEEKARYHGALKRRWRKEDRIRTQRSPHPHKLHA